MGKVTYSDCGVSHGPPAPARGTYSASDDAIEMGPYGLAPPPPPQWQRFIRKRVAGSLDDSGSQESHHGFVEPHSRAPVGALEAVEDRTAPVREPPAWRLNYGIGSGPCGTVFLEKVQTHRMEFPEL